jgi:hypothetical protein
VGVTVIPNTCGLVEEVLGGMALSPLFVYVGA